MRKKSDLESKLTDRQLTHCHLTKDRQVKRFANRSQVRAQEHWVIAKDEDIHVTDMPARAPNDTASPYCNMLSRRTILEVIADLGEVDLGPSRAVLQ
jgi:hypothetical protein